MNKSYTEILRDMLHKEYGVTLENAKKQQIDDCVSRLSDYTDDEVYTDEE